MHISHYVDSLDPKKGGVSSYLLDLVENIKTCDDQIEVELNYFDKSELVKFTELCGKVILNKKKCNLQQLLKDFRASDHCKNKIIHNHGLWLPSNLYARLLAKKGGCALMTSVHGTLESWALNSKKIKKQIAWFFYEKTNLQSADVVHVFTPMEAESVRRLGFKNPLAVIPAGIRLESNKIYSRAVAFETEKKTLLFLSRIDNVKGLERLLSIWQRQAKCFPNWELVIAGNGSDTYVAKLKALAKEKGIDDSRLRWMGFVQGEDKTKLFNQASVFILPTFSENFGIAIGEALSHGVPVITTNGTPWAEIQTERCGWYTENNEGAIEKALVEALNTPEPILKEMGMRGRVLIEKKYTWPKVAKEMVDTYRWMLKMGDKPDCVQ